MSDARESLKPIPGADRSLRQRLSLKEEFALALLPTAMVLSVLLLLEILSEQRLLFASLASSAFLIYLDPQHGTNTIRTLVIAHLAAALLGWGADGLVTNSYQAAAIGMVLSIATMIALDVVHPPAVATALSFAFRAGHQSNLALFLLSLLIIVALVLLQRSLLWILAHMTRRRNSPEM